MKPATLLQRITLPHPADSMAGIQSCVNRNADPQLVRQVASKSEGRSVKFMAREFWIEITSLSGREHTFNGHLGDGFDATFEGHAGICEQYGWITH